MMHLGNYLGSQYYYKYTISVSSVPCLPFFIANNVNTAHRLVYIDLNLSE